MFWELDSSRFHTGGQLAFLYADTSDLHHRRVPKSTCLPCSRRYKRQRHFAAISRDGESSMTEKPVLWFVCLPARLWVKVTTMKVTTVKA
mmetsp:Transcript_17928/g.26600  ORF Transcript_17928/g.26600 Transcript_17928/m.26600 type:complete len:90 (+) Transcript_17928:1109-1378(+)